MITIDLDNVDFKLHSWGIQAMQNKFITQIMRIRNENVLQQNILFDTIVVSPIIFNFIADCGGFGKFQSLSVESDGESLTKVGYLNHLEVWLDLNLPRHECYLTLSSTDLRDSKIEDILSESSVSKCYKVEIMVSSSVL